MIHLFCFTISCSCGYINIFGLYVVRVWNIEMSNEYKIDQLLLYYGYMKVRKLTYFRNKLDSVYVKNPKEFLLPWEDGKEMEMWNNYQSCDR